METNKAKINKTADMKLYMKQYRISNKDKWTKPIKCKDCNKTYTASNATNHFRSKLHQIAALKKENEKLIKKKFHH